MARKSTKPRAVQRSLLTLKGSPEWLDWLKRYADHAGVATTTAMIDLALREQAKRDGFEPMPKRNAR